MELNEALETIREVFEDWLDSDGVYNENEIYFMIEEITQKFLKANKTITL